MYKKILVPLDGSKLAECALQHAESLAHAFDSTLLLISVIISPAPIVGRAPVDIEAFQKSMDARRDEAENYLKGKMGEFTEKTSKQKSISGLNRWSEK